MADSLLDTRAPGPGWSLVTARRAPVPTNGGSCLVDAFGVPVARVLLATRGWSGGTTQIVWDEMAWLPDPAESIVSRLDDETTAGVIVDWSLVVAGTQRSFVRAPAPAASAAALAAAPTRVSLHGPVPGMDPAAYQAAFREHCVVTEEHMRLAVAYRQTEVTAHLRHCDSADRTVLGISEFWFATEEDAVRMYANETESGAVGRHAREFVDPTGAVTVCGLP
jgi:hypothetical protein